jgi:hypothetical protein
MQRPIGTRDQTRDFKSTGHVLAPPSSCCYPYVFGIPAQCIYVLAKDPHRSLFESTDKTESGSITYLLQLGNLHSRTISQLTPLEG